LFMQNILLYAPPQKLCLYLLSCYAFRI